MPLADLWNCVCCCASACARSLMLSPDPALRPSWRVAAGHMVMWQDDAAKFRRLLELLRPFFKYPLWTHGTRPLGTARDPSKAPTPGETLGTMLSACLEAGSLLVSGAPLIAWQGRGT